MDRSTGFIGGRGARHPMGDAVYVRRTGTGRLAGGAPGLQEGGTAGDEAQDRKNDQQLLHCRFPPFEWLPLLPAAYPLPATPGGLGSPASRGGGDGDCRRSLSEHMMNPGRGLRGCACATPRSARRRPSSRSARSASWSIPHSTPRAARTGPPRSRASGAPRSPGRHCRRCHRAHRRGPALARPALRQPRSRRAGAAADHTHHPDHPPGRPAAGRQRPRAEALGDHDADRQRREGGADHRHPGTPRGRPARA